MAITKKTFTVADTPVDAGRKKESASTHRKYPATKSQMTLFDRALFMMTSWLPGAGITHALGRTTQAEQTVTEAFTVLELRSAKVCSRRATRKSFARSEPYRFWDPKRSFGSIYWTCLPALVTDRAMEAWYHSSLHCMNDPQPEGSHGKLHPTTKILSHASRRRGGRVAACGARAAVVDAGDRALPHKCPEKWGFLTGCEAGCEARKSPPPRAQGRAGRRPGGPSISRTAQDVDAT